MVAYDLAVLVLEKSRLSRLPSQGPSKDKVRNRCKGLPRFTLFDELIDNLTEFHLQLCCLGKRNTLA